MVLMTPGFRSLVRLSTALMMIACAMPTAHAAADGIADLKISSQLLSLATR